MLINCLSYDDWFLRFLAEPINGGVKISIWIWISKTDEDEEAVSIWPDDLSSNQTLVLLFVFREQLM